MNRLLITFHDDHFAGLSAGTFLYVGIVEMIHSHIESRLIPWYGKLFSVMLGSTALIGFLFISGGEEH